jgi:hypothetical protein
MKISKTSVFLSFTLGLFSLAGKVLAFGPTCTGSANLQGGGSASVSVDCDNYDGGPNCSCTASSGTLTVSCSMGGPTTTSSTTYSGTATGCSASYGSLQEY